MNREQLERIREAESAAALWALLRGVDAAQLSGREVDVITRSLKRFPASEAPVRMAFLGNHTMEPLAARTAVHAAASGIGLGAWVAPYGQHMQAILDEGSGLRAHAPGIIFLNLTMRALAPELHSSFASLDLTARERERDRIIAHIDEWVGAALAATDALLLIANFHRPAQAAFGSADARQELGEGEFYMALNLELMRRYRGEPRICMIDLDRLVLAHGAEHALSDRLYHLAKIPWSETFTARVAEELTRYALAASGAGRKCLVIDLDNTLWGGVVGEDGPAGLQIGSGTPAGEAYADFQRALKGLQVRGVALAICSKNNLADVDEAFATHADMPLKREDFVAERINWEPKPANIVAITEELNIGVDAVAFVDDNPMERELVRGALPEVAVIDLPADPADYSATLRRQILFDRLDVTAEDRAKVYQYRQQSKRRRFEHSTGDLSAYLAGLETQLVVRPARPSDLPRVHQLFTKTNQFNITTRRYGPADIERFTDDSCCDLSIAQLQDRFGDLGVIALYLVRRDGHDADIDSFVMSCRALGRDAETALMNWLKARHATVPGRLTASFIPTARNAPARDFLAKQGFRLIAEASNGVWRYELEAARATAIACPHITIKEEQA